MNLVLINLPAEHLKQPNAQVPLGILYIAACLKDVQVKNYANYTTEQAISNLPEAGNYGITCTSLQLPQANEFAKRIKEKYPNSKTILGGMGTVTPQYVDYDWVDSIMIGEGEITINNFLNDKEKQPFYLGEQVNVNKLPFPARHLINDQGGNIFGNNKNYFEGGSAQILTNRGCGCHCSFCAAPKLNSWVRLRKIDSVIEEIEQIIEKYNIRQFRIADDNFIISKNRVLEFCEKVKLLDIAFRISARVKPFTYEMAIALKESGCREISFGIESFDDNVLNMLNKGTNAFHNYKALEICKTVGIKTRMLFMIGTPGQTPETIKINCDAIKHCPFDLVACTHFIPLPGSDIYEHPEKYDIEILDYDLKKYNFYAYDGSGKRDFYNIFKLKNRDNKVVQEENRYFIDMLEKTGKLNNG